MLLENGTYKAVVKDISVYLRGEQERLTAAFRLECEGKELLHREWLELNDGTISDRAIRRLRQCFPKWDGNIETLEQGACVQDVDVDITIENEQDRDDPEKWWTRTRYMDPPGGAMSAAALPESESRTTLVSKYGARFRALSPLQADGQAGPPSIKPPVQMPLETPVTPATLEECWDAMCAKFPNELREQVGKRWFPLVDRIAPGKDQDSIDPTEWGRVLIEVKKLS
jgi:hypothetical protein